MVTTSELRVEAQDIATDALEDLRDRPGIFKSSVSLMRKQPLGTFGLLIVLVMIAMAIFAPYLSSIDPEANSFEHQLAAPGGQFYLGTDEFGRDVFTRIMYGARTALFVGLVSAFVGSSIGLVLGVASAYFGGRFDLIFQRVMDVFMAFPLIIMALAVVSIFGTGIQNVILAITIPFIPRCARVVRSSALAIREIPYIDAARANGFSNSRIISKKKYKCSTYRCLETLKISKICSVLISRSSPRLGFTSKARVSSLGALPRPKSVRSRSE